MLWSTEGRLQREDVDRGGGCRRPGSPPGSRRRTEDKVRPAKREGAESAPGSSFHPPTSRAERRGLAASRLPLFPPHSPWGPQRRRSAPPSTSAPKGRGAERACPSPRDGEKVADEGPDEGPKSSQAAPSPHPNPLPVPGRGGWLRRFPTVQPYHPVIPGAPQAREGDPEEPGGRRPSPNLSGSPSRRCAPPGKTASRGKEPALGLTRGSARKRATPPRRPFAFVACRCAYWSSSCCWDGGGVGGDRDRADTVLLVDVVAELGEAVGRGPSGDVDPVDRHRLGQLGVNALAGLDGLVDLVARPAGRVLQEPGHVVAHVLHAHAAGRDEAEIVSEDALGRSVVHVDAIGVGDVDAHHAERVEVAARILAEHEVRRLVRPPVDLRRADLLAFLADTPGSCSRSGSSRRPASSGSGPS